MIFLILVCANSADPGQTEQSDQHFCLHHLAAFSCGKTMCLDFIVIVTNFEDVRKFWKIMAIKKE